MVGRRLIISTSSHWLIPASMIHSFSFFFIANKVPRNEEEDETRTQQSWQRVKAIKLSQEILLRRGEKIIYIFLVSLFQLQFMLESSTHSLSEEKKEKPENLLLNISEIVFMSLFSIVVQY
jgi:hypothetical protein